MCQKNVSPKVKPLKRHCFYLIFNGVKLSDIAGSQTGTVAFLPHPLTDRVVDCLSRHTRWHFLKDILFKKL